jgi:ubiquinone/menaquinone biosynthesis C-methylase UbiE
LPKVFDKYAERYDSWYRRHRVLFKCEAEAIRALNLRGRGLSVGVGTGILDSQAPIEIGVDPALNMLKLASTRRIEPFQGVGEHLPFRDGGFDFALLTLTLCFLNTPEKVIPEVKRVLRSTGELVVCIIPKDSVWGKVYIKKREAGYDFYSHARFYSLAELEELLTECSFRVVATKATLSYPPSTTPRLEKPSENPEGRGFVCVKTVKC